MLQPGQIQLRDLVMGLGTVYTVKDFNPFDTSIEPMGSGKLPYGHGGWNASEWATERAIPMTIQINAPSETAARNAVRVLKYAFRPTEIHGPMELRWRDVTGEYVAFGHPRMSNPDSRNLSVGICDVSCAVVTPIPFYYSAEETVTGPVLPPTTTGGFSLPMRVPFSIPGRSATGTTMLVNDGTADAALRLEIYGPTEDPWVLLTRADEDPEKPRVLRLNLTIPDGQVLYIDTGTRSVLLNGVSSRRGDASSDGREWPILPGGPEPTSTPIRYFGAGHLIVRHRSAWW